MPLSDYTALQDFCDAAGEPMKASYRIKQLATLLDVDADTLYDEIDGGRLSAYMPRGRERGRRVLAREANRWLEAVWCG